MSLQVFRLQNIIHCHSIVAFLILLTLIVPVQAAGSWGIPYVTIDVVDSNTHQSLSNAKVTLDSSTGYTKADGQVVFKFHNQKTPDTRWVKVSLNGYQDAVRVLSGDQTYQQILLEPITPVVTRVPTAVPTLVPTTPVAADKGITLQSILSLILSWDSENNVNSVSYRIVYISIIIISFSCFFYLLFRFIRRRNNQSPQYPESKGSEIRQEALQQVGDSIIENTVEKIIHRIFQRIFNFIANFILFIIRLIWPFN